MPRSQSRITVHPVGQRRTAWTWTLRGPDGQLVAIPAKEFATREAAAHAVMQLRKAAAEAAVAVTC